MKRLLLLLLAVVTLTITAHAQSSTAPGVTVTDGTTTWFRIRKITMPAGTVSSTPGTVTISGLGASFTNGSKLDDTALGAFRFGGAASATPHTQSFAIQNGVGTNIAGANFTFINSLGTGTGVGGNGIFQVGYPGTTGTTLATASTVFTLFGTNNQSSGTAVANALISFTPTVNQSSTAGYDGLLINVTESATGSGTKNLLDLAVASTSKFSVDDTGALHFPNASVFSDGGAASFLFGGANAASPAAQTIGFSGGTGSNIAGANALFVGSIGTGTGVGGNLGFKLAYPGTTGSSANTTSTVLSLNGLNNQSSGTNIANPMITLSPTVNQSSTAGYDGVAINVTESATGSGTKDILDLQVAGATKLDINDTGVIGTYKGVATAGGGVAAILGFTSQKAETTTADTNVLTVTPPALAGTYRVSVVISVASATSGVISWTISYKDSNANAQSNIAEQLFQTGTAAPNTTFTTSAAGNYYGSVIIDADNSATAIIVKWVGGGTTSAKMSASIERLN